MVPFSIALINQASCAADFNQLFFQIFPNVFLLLRSCEYKATSVYASLLFGLEHLHVLPSFLFLFISFCELFICFPSFSDLFGQSRWIMQLVWYKDFLVGTSARALSRSIFSSNVLSPMYSSSTLLVSNTPQIVRCLLDFFLWAALFLGSRGTNNQFLLTIHIFLQFVMFLLIVLKMIFWEKGLLCHTFAT